MSWVVLAIGIMIALLGWVIGHFNLVKLLSNVDANKLIDPTKATRRIAYYLYLLSICLVILSRFIETMSDRSLIVLIACFIPLNMVVVVSYMVAQSRNMK